MDSPSGSDALTSLARLCLTASDGDQVRAESPALLDAATADGSGEIASSLVETALARLEAEQALADLTGRVNNAQSLANMGDYDWHIATDSNRWSDQLFRIYGHEPQSFNASYERFLSLIHPDDRERITGIHQQAYGSGEPYQMIERIVRPDGEVRYLASNGQVLMGADGAPERMRGTCIDITDRVLAEEAREHSAARFRGLVEATPDAILVLDRAGKVLDANGRASDLLGGNPTGRRIDDILPSGAITGQGIDATTLHGKALCLDVVVADLVEGESQGVHAAFLHDARPRLDSEATAARLREAQVRRKQALEINDNVVQGLSAAATAMEQGEVGLSASFLDRTLTAARRMMNDLLDPLTGEDLRPGDLVREHPAGLDPLVEPVPEPAAAPDRSVRVLIVDDSEDLRELLVLRLAKHAQFEIVGQAADGEEAVRVAAELQPDVVLLDLSMPVMDGLEALPLIISAVTDVRVIVMSGFDRKAMAGRALAAGACRYVEKGLKMNVATVIDEVLRGPRSEATTSP